MPHRVVWCNLAHCFASVVLHGLSSDVLACDGKRYASFLDFGCLDRDTF